MAVNSSRYDTAKQLQEVGSALYPISYRGTSRYVAIYTIITP